MKGIVVGGLQFSPEDSLPAPIISVDYATEDEAKAAAGVLVTLQNGICPLKMGQAKPVYMGDTNIKVSFVRMPSCDDVLCEISAKHDPRHLTYGFYAASMVSVDQVKAFRKLLEVHGNYAFTVSHNGSVLTSELDLVKYAVTVKGVPS